MTEPTITDAQVPESPHGPYKSIAAIRRANNELGHYWFDPRTLQYFASVIYPHVYGGYLFVTSEKVSQEDSARRYHIRRADDRGCIWDHGLGIDYLTKEGAMAAAKYAASETPHPENTNV